MNQESSFAYEFVAHNDWSLIWVEVALRHHTAIAAKELEFVLRSWGDLVLNVGQKSPNESCHGSGQVHYRLLLVFLKLFEGFFGEVIQNVGLAGLAASIYIHKRPFIVTASWCCGIIRLSTDVSIEQVLAGIVTPNTIPVVRLNCLVGF